MVDRRKLKKLIARSVKAYNETHLATQALNEFCEDTFGFAPSDRDVDGIIDAVFGGCGTSTVISVDEFIELMEKAK